MYPSVLSWFLIFVCCLFVPAPSLNAHPPPPPPPGDVGGAVGVGGGGRGGYYTVALLNV